LTDSGVFKISSVTAVGFLFFFVVDLGVVGSSVGATSQRVFDRLREGVLKGVLKLGEPDSVPL
jgi:hypothetical protein